MLFSAEEMASMQGGIRPVSPKDYKLPDKFPSLARAKRISLDVESHDPWLGQKMGPGWRRGAYIIGFGLSLGDNKGGVEFSEYYPLRHQGHPNLDTERVYDWLRDELAFYQGEIVGANLLYDADGYQYQGITAPLAKWRDVQWAEAIIDENAFNYTLERLSQKYCGTGKVQDEIKGLYGPDVKERMREVHPGYMRAYGIGDVVLPLRVLHEQYKELRKQGMENLFDIESRLLPMLLYMRRRGQRIDMRAAEQLFDIFSQKRAECLREASKLVPLRGFELTVENFGKPQVITTALDALGIKYPRTAPTDTHPNGQPSIKDKWLEKLEHPFGALLAKANKYDKAKETFVDGYVTDFQINGRLHCEFHPLRKVDDESGDNNGTISGRFSSVHPNLQNIPARDKEIGPLCRAMFIAEAGDYDYFSGDYSQIEFRLLVHCACMLSKVTGKARKWDDETAAKLKTAFTALQMYLTDAKTDFHDMVAKLTGLARKYAKGINFGIAFTMGVDKLAREIGEQEPDPDKPGELRPTKRAHEILKQYHDNVPFVKAVGSAMSRMAKDDGFTQTLLGRRSHFELWEPRNQDFKNRAKALPLVQAKDAYSGQKLQRAMTHKALNCYTQGGGADLMKVSMVKAWEAGLLDSENLIISLTVHDELDGSVARNKDGEERLRELQNIMETAILLESGMTTMTEFKRGANWAETH